MDIISIIVSLALGTIIGGIIGVLYSKNKSGNLIGESVLLKKTLDTLKNDLQIKDSELKNADKNFHSLETQLAILQNDLNLKDESIDKLQHQQESQDKDYKNKIQRLQEENNRQFNEAKENWENLRISALAEKEKNFQGLLTSKNKQYQDMLQQKEDEIHRLQTNFEKVKKDLQNDLQQQKVETKEQIQIIQNEWQRRNRISLDEKEKTCNDLLEAKDKEYRAILEGHLERMNTQMKSVTEKMLKDRQVEFEESSKLNIGQIVTPLKETIERMKQTMNDSTLKQTAMSSEMKANIENMLKQSEAAQKSTEELTRVFKHGTKIQGDWGETVLDEILESQGLIKGVHYETQPVIKDVNGHVIKSEDGNIMRPDVIIHLDTRREVIVDSKVSLTAFMDYVNAENEDERKIFIKSHVDSIEKHVKELSNKDYSSYIQPPKLKMDYVIMFVPHSGALWTALNYKPDLWRRAMEKNVFIADEQTLYAAVRIINLTWTQIAQAQNHEKVFELANEMLDRVGQFMKKFELIGKSLDNAKKAYEEGSRKLQPKGQSILTTCSKLEQLGAKQSDKNPLPRILDVDDIPILEDGNNSNF